MFVRSWDIPSGSRIPSLVVMDRKRSFSAPLRQYKWLGVLSLRPVVLAGEESAKVSTQIGEIRSGPARGTEKRPPSLEYHFDFPLPTLHSLPSFVFSPCLCVDLDPLLPPTSLQRILLCHQPCPCVTRDKVAHPHSHLVFGHNENALLPDPIPRLFKLGSTDATSSSRTESLGYNVYYILRCRDTSASSSCSLPPRFLI